MTDAAPLLAARGVSKSFFGNPVLRDVSITLLPGRVHALLGENGAGKSTLINILSGALPADGGSVEINGRTAERLTPSEAKQAGIAVVQQELSLTASLSIAENIGLGDYPRRFGIIDYRTLAARATVVSALVGLDEPLSTPVGALPLGRRQMVEIAKALYRKPRVLILDEPTSSLSASETAILTALLERLRGEGVAILYISHRLNEVMALCQHVTVLKDGSVTADRPLVGTDAAGLVRLMVGRDPGDLFPRWHSSASTSAVVSVKGFSAGLARDIDIDIRHRRGAGDRRAGRPGPGGFVARALRRHTGKEPRRQRSTALRRCRPACLGPTHSASPMCRRTASARACISSSRSPLT